MVERMVNMEYHAAIDFIPQLTGYLASNFIWMASCDSFHNVPFELLLTCVKQPCLTVDSEKHLCDAILLWLAANTNPSDRLSSTGDARLEILTEIRTSLLSLPFAAGKRRCPFFSKFAERSVVAICSLAASRSFILADILGGGDCNQLRIRLTEYTKVVSDSVVRNILETLKNLQVLALCYCFGEISSLSFQSSAPRLRKLKLERVSTQMTNDDLLILSRNCMNLTELSLVGCKRLNSESQDTISNGWPGLISLHLEDCGEVTAQGVTSLMNCQALEDLLLRHNGLGIDRNCIIRAASRMPLLRKVAVDVCDAKDGDFDLPDFPDRNFLCILKIARCNLKRRAFGSTKSGTCTTPVHAETLILTWDSRKLSRTVVKERL